MAQLQYKTRANTPPNGKPRIYLSCHPGDADRWTQQIANDLLEQCDCAVFYYDDPASVTVDETYLSNLEQVQLLVIPVTRKLLSERGRTLDTDLPLVMEKNISMLPIVVESNILDLYPSAFGSVQFLDRCQQDSTAISYSDKLAAYLNAVTLQDAQIQKIREAFDSYIFLSYRKKDRKYAQELMRLIHDTEDFSDVAIWYDEYLVPGEDFSALIEKMLHTSPVFALAVTPHLLEQGNYVMDHEYPAAQNANKPILAAQMLPTNTAQLQNHYKNIPDCTDPNNKTLLEEALRTCFRDITLGANRNDPEHMYYMGLAYLNGVDVEVDRSRAVAYMEKAAFADLPEAVEKLADMYLYGQGLPRNQEKANAWRCRLYTLLREQLTQQALLNGTKAQLPDRPLTVQEQQLICWYLDNLQKVVENCQSKGWAQSALFSFFCEGDDLFKISWLRKYLPLYASCARNKHDVLQLAETLYKEDDRWENGLLLAQVCLAVEKEAKEEALVKKAEKLCRKALKQKDDPELKLTLAECLLFSVKDQFKLTPKQNDICWEAAGLCHGLAQNSMHIAAIRLLADAVYKLPVEESSLDRLRPLMDDTLHLTEMVYRFTNEKADEARLHNIYSQYSHYCSCRSDYEKSDLYRKKSDTLDYSDTDYFWPRTKNRFRLLQAYLALAKKGEQLRADHLAISWDREAVLLYHHAEQVCTAQEELEILQRQIRLDRPDWEQNGKLDRYIQKAIELWEKKNCMGAGLLKAQLLMEELAQMDKPENVIYGHCGQALCAICEDLFLQWHIATLLGKSVPPRKPMEEAATALGWVDKYIHKPIFTNWYNTCLEAIACLQALDALYLGDPLKALDLAQKVDQFPEDRVASLTPKICAGELYALLCFPSRPRIKDVQEQLLNLMQTAIHRRKKAENSLQNLAITADHCAIAQFLIQTDQRQQAFAQLEEAKELSWKTEDTETVLWVRLHFAALFVDLLRESAPDRAESYWHSVLFSLKTYLEEIPDVALLHKYLEQLCLQQEREYGTLQMAVMLVQLDDRPESWRLLSYLAYLEKSLYGKRELAFILQVQEKLLARENTPEVRRQLAKTLTRIQVMEEEVRDSAKEILQLQKSRLLRARKLVEENREQTQEDKILLCIADYKLQALFPEEYSAEEKARIKEAYLEYTTTPSLRLQNEAIALEVGYSFEDGIDDSNLIFVRFFEKAQALLPRNNDFSEVLAVYEVLQEQFPRGKKRSGKAFAREVMDQYGQKALALCDTLTEQTLCGYGHGIPGLREKILDKANRIYNNFPANLTPEQRIRLQRRLRAIYFNNMEYEQAMLIDLELMDTLPAVFPEYFYSDFCGSTLKSYLERRRIEEARFILEKLLQLEEDPALRDKLHIRRHNWRSVFMVLHQALNFSVTNHALLTDKEFWQLFAPLQTKIAALLDPGRNDPAEARFRLGEYEQLDNYYTLKHCLQLTKQFYHYDDDHLQNKLRLRRQNIRRLARKGAYRKARREFYIKEKKELV
ncbi:MAG: toll/interleukin-1 receptor domain-containing protein [Oscillospiraceae bacterium]|nr:toll/interleukin-1 receptor domain-containing protein [Oscillospiraceae bacterium]